jgi:geranylgeranyl diphosphate synthase, type II
MGIEDKLEGIKVSIDRELKSVLEALPSLTGRPMKYSVMSGGKRFRPLLLITSGELFGCGQEKSLPFACALELIHNYSLIHDDLPAMDDDDFRRGKPSCHKAFGEAAAVLTGDSILTLAFEIMTRALLEKNNREERFLIKGLHAMEEISRAAGPGGMIEGQFLDLSAQSKTVTEKEYYKLVLKKTGALIIVAVRAGAWLGGATEEERKNLTAFARNIGLAFQIRDDLLDSPQESQPGSNAVSLEGMTSARKRLIRHVFSAVKELEKLSQDTHALRYLALKLLEVS